MASRTSYSSDEPDASAHPDASDDIPLTTTASLHLSTLPPSAADALASDLARLSAPLPSSAAGVAPGKVRVRFKPVGSAPALAQDVVDVSADRKFDVVVRYVRKKLGCGDGDSAFLYVNQAFAPSLDEVVGNLHQVIPPLHLTPRGRW